MAQHIQPSIKDDLIIQVKITGREAHLLKELRRYPYGSFTITKINNYITRLQISDSKLINEEDGADIAINSNKRP